MKIVRGVNGKSSSSALGLKVAAAASVQQVVFVMGKLRQDDLRQGNNDKPPIHRIKLGDSVTTTDN